MWRGGEGHALTRPAPFSPPLPSAPSLPRSLVYAPPLAPPPAGIAALKHTNVVRKLERRFAFVPDPYRAVEIRRQLDADDAARELATRQATARDGAPSCVPTSAATPAPAMPPAAARTAGSAPAESKAESEAASDATAARSSPQRRAPKPPAMRWNVALARPTFAAEQPQYVAYEIRATHSGELRGAPSFDLACHLKQHTGALPPASLPYYCLPRGASSVLLAIALAAPAPSHAAVAFASKVLGAHSVPSGGAGGGGDGDAALSACDASIHTFLLPLDDGMQVSLSYLPLTFCANPANNLTRPPSYMLCTVTFLLPLGDGMQTRFVYGVCIARAHVVSAESGGSLDSAAARVVQIDAVCLLAGGGRFGEQSASPLAALRRSANTLLERWTDSARQFPSPAARGEALDELFRCGEVRGDDAAPSSERGAEQRVSLEEERAALAAEAPPAFSFPAAPPLTAPPPRSEPPPRPSCAALLANVLSVQNMIEVFESLLLERPVVLVSSSIALLTIAAEAFRSFLEPLPWLHTYAPVLPSALAPELARRCAAHRATYRRVQQRRNLDARRNASPLSPPQRSKSVEAKVAAWTPAHNIAQRTEAQGWSVSTGARDDASRRGSRNAAADAAAGAAASLAASSAPTVAIDQYVAALFPSEQAEEEEEAAAADAPGAPAGGAPGAVSLGEARRRAALRRSVNSGVFLFTVTF